MRNMSIYASMFDDNTPPEAEEIISQEKLDEVRTLLLNTFRMNASVHGASVNCVSELTPEFETFIIHDYDFDSLAEKIMRIRKPDAIQIHENIEPVLSDDADEFKYVVKLKSIFMTGAGDESK